MSTHEPVPRQGRALDRALLLVALAFALGARLYVGSRQYVEYDGYWHVFIAGQQELGQAWEEARVNAHPPLYFLLLRLTLRLGPALLAYRLVSIVAGVAAVGLAWVLAARLTRSRVAPALAAAVMAASQAALVVSLEVRSYMLAVAFQLAALVPWLDVAGLRGPHAPRPAPRAAFALLASAAVLSHYGSVFVLAACAAAPLLLALLDPAYRQALGARLRTTWPADLATAALPALVTAALMLAHVRGLDVRFNHLPEFYFRPGAETIPAFLARTLAATAALFAPANGRGGGAVLALLAGASVIVLLLHARRGADALTRAVPAAFLLLMTGGFALAALRGLYPFGGALRHQFFLFPFLVLTLVAAADLVMQRLPRRWEPAAAAAGAALVLTIGAVRVAAFPITPRGPFADPVAAWARAFPHPAAVFVDQFNLIGLFSERADWTWRALPKSPALPNVNQYVLERGQERVQVLQRRRWNVDFHQRGTYQDIRRILERTGLASTTTFVVRQFQEPRNERQQERFRRQIGDLAGEAGLEATRVELDGQNVYAELSLRRPPP